MLIETDQLILYEKISIRLSFFFCWQATSIIATDFYVNRFQVLITICFDYKLISFSVRSMRSVYPHYSMGLKPIWRLLVVINTYDLLRLLNACYFVRVFRLYADRNAQIFWNSLENQFEINGFLSIIISINLLNGIHTNVSQSPIIPMCNLYQYKKYSKQFEIHNKMCILFIRRNWLGCLFT